MALLMRDTWKLPVERRTVTLYVRTDQGSTFADPVVVTDAFRTAIDRDDEARPGELLTRQRTRWHLWKVKLPQPPLPPVEPHTDDVIDDGAGRWTVVTVSDQGQDTRYRCECIREVS